MSTAPCTSGALANETNNLALLRSEIELILSAMHAEGVSTHKYASRDIIHSSECIGDGNVTAGFI